MKSQLQALREQKRIDDSALSINAAFERLSEELKRFRGICYGNRSPLRSVTFRVLDDGNTRTHVVYRKKN